MQATVTARDAQQWWAFEKWLREHAEPGETRYETLCRILATFVVR